MSDYLKALGLSAEESAKQKLAKKMGLGQEKQAGVAVQLQMTGIPPLDGIIEALNAMAQTIDALPAALDSFAPALEKAFIPLAAAMRAQDEKLAAQSGVIAELAAKVEALTALQEKANAIALAPVMPEFDANGKITSARKVM